MSKFEKDVQGVALYLEFRKVGATCQVLLTPDGFAANDGGVVPAQFFRRVLHSGVTKRKWRAYVMRQTQTQSEDLMYGRENTLDAAQQDAAVRIRNLGDYFDSLVRGGYKLVNDTPIYVEVTKDDLTAARAGNLSTKLWSRVKSSRVSLGFPEEITNSTTTTL